MRKFILAAIVLLTGPLLVAQHALNNDAIIRMLNAGLSEDIIITTINAAVGHYDTSTDGLIALKKAGASNKIIVAIAAKSSTPTSSSLPATTAVADTNDPASPHIPGIYLMLDGWDGKQKMVHIEQLESNTVPPMVSTSIKANILGSHAVLRTSTPKPIFYLYFPSSSGITDSSSPSEFTLLSMKVKGDHRETEVAHKKAVLGGYVIVTGIKESNVIHSSSEKVAPNIFKVMPDVDMPPGEYAFIASRKLSETGAASFFDFGVDPK